jgi:hypothetical protein
MVEDVGFLEGNLTQLTLTWKVRLGGQPWNCIALPIHYEEIWTFLWFS